MKTTRYPYLLLAGLLLSGRAHAQEATPSRVIVISPVVGEVIDADEKARYGLFPTFSADDFQQASFHQALRADSTVTLHLQLRDGRVVLRPYSPAEVAAVRQQVADRSRELAASGIAPTDSVGRRYRVTLRTGTSFEGELKERQPKQLQFETKDLGRVLVERSNIQRLDDLTANPTKRPANWHDIGNGNRLFFAPTARNLRRQEGSLQLINVYVLGANYGITDNFSMGLMASVIPALPLSDQFLAVTPKFSAQIAPDWHAGVGVLYLNVPSFSANDDSYGVGLAYGVATYGSADNNVTVGLGYGFAGGDIGSTPVLQVGGQRRISRQVSLISENYIIANSDAGMGGLYGAKINWRRTSLGLGAAYVLPFSEGTLLSTYIVPVYFDFTFRFGKGSR